MLRVGMDVGKGLWSLDLRDFGNHVRSSVFGNWFRGVWRYIYVGFG